MSRCFPYPPPGFTKKASDVATLIDSIKLQKENKANKEKRKEKRREKKEKKREKKDKKEPVDSEQNKVGLDTHKDGKIWTESDGVLSQKRKREETEQLEGSSLTEEHEQPLNSQNPSYSSDGTQNSNKRRKQASVASVSPGNGNIIRIKLPLQNHKESESPARIEQLNSTSARNVHIKESDVKSREDQEQLCSTSGRNVHIKESDVKSREDQEQLCSTSGRNEIHDEQIYSGSGLMDFAVYPGEDVSRGSKGDASLTLFRKTSSLHGFPCPSNEFGSMSGNTDNFTQSHAQASVSVIPQDKKVQKKVSKYDSLIQNLYEIVIPSEVVDSDGEDWLFGGKRLDTVVKERKVEKQLPVNSGVTCSSSSTLYPLYPRARYLEEAKIYALPYTVPF